MRRFINSRSCRSMRMYCRLSSEILSLSRSSVTSTESKTSYGQFVRPRIVCVRRTLASFAAVPDHAPHYSLLLRRLVLAGLALRLPLGCPLVGRVIESASLPVVMTLVTFRQALAESAFRWYKTEGHAAIALQEHQVSYHWRETTLSHLPPCPRPAH